MVPPRLAHLGSTGDSLYPAQWFGRLSVHSLPAEQRLMLAVLEHAVNEYQQTARATDARGRRLFAEAIFWFESDDDTWPFSFVSICHALGIDVSYLRGGLARWRAAARREGVRLQIGPRGRSADPRLAAR